MSQLSDRRLTMKSIYFKRFILQNVYSLLLSVSILGFLTIKVLDIFCFVISICLNTKCHKEQQKENEQQISAM